MSLILEMSDIFLWNSGMHFDENAIKIAFLSSWHQEEEEDDIMSPDKWWFLSLV